MIVVMFCQNYFAQSDSLFKAQELCNQKKYTEAIKVIDKAILNTETATDAATWHIRAFAYIQTYKQQGAANTQKINLLDTAISSAIKSNFLDDKKEYLENNNAFIKNGSTTYYKLAVFQINDSLNAGKSEFFYNKYKKYYKIIDPSFDFKAKDIEYYNVVGGQFEDLYIKNNFNKNYGDITKTALLKVLDLDPKNISANINLGILYYNQGAALMNELDYDAQLDKLDVIQDNAAKLFKQSLPFMLKVYELEPKDKRVIEGLEGIYSALLDEAKSNEFKRKKEALNNNK